MDPPHGRIQLEHGETEQEEKLPVPDNVPLLHVLVVDEGQVEPQATDDVEYACTELPFRTVVPHGVVQLEQAATEHELKLPVPDNVPLLHVLDVGAGHDDPQGTEAVV